MPFEKIKVFGAALELPAKQHPDRFLAEMFHDYAFKECIFVENLKS